MEEVNQSEMVPAKLPQFLKVLCILTFIAVGLGLVSGLYSLVKAPYALEEYETMMEMSGGAFEGECFMASIMEMGYQNAVNALPLAITTIGANLFCLFGALMMWKLRKVGFYAYVCGQVIAIAVPSILMGFSGWMMLGAIFPLAFIKEPDNSLNSSSFISLNSTFKSSAHLKTLLLSAFRLFCP